MRHCLQAATAPRTGSNSAGSMAITSATCAASTAVHPPGAAPTSMATDSGDGWYAAVASASVSLPAGWQTWG